MSNLLVALAAVIQISVGLLVYHKKKNSLTNITFGFIALTTLAWAITNYAYTLYPASSSALELIRAVLFFVVLQNTVFYVFAHNYPSDVQTIQHRKLFLFLFLSGVVALMTLSPYVFSSVTVSHGQSNPNPGPLIPLFMLHAVYSIGSGLRSIYKKIGGARGRSKKGLQFIFIASVLNWVVVPITNFAITLALHTTFFAKVSPLYTLIFGAIIAYAIVAQRLFDIQAAVARSVAYTLTLVSLAALYFIATFLVLSFLFGISVRVQTQVIYIVLALLLSASFQPIKKMFDRATNKLFYQDAYDAQAFLDQLNRALVANNELEDLLNACSQIIASNMKLRYCLFGIKESGFKGIRIIGTAKKDFSTEEIMTARRATPLLGSGVIITDYLPAEADKLKQVLIKNDVAALVRLVPEFASNQEGLGYIILGPKRSGSMYTSQDIQLLGIIANELVIAIQNALHFEEIQAFNVTLQERISEATKKLRKTNERLKLLDETKDDFISMASHQLRTPLTSVKGYLSLVLDGDAGTIKPNQRKLLTQAFISSQRMVYLIADLLNVSRLRTGKFVIEPTPINLADVVQEEVNQLVETAQGRSLQLTYHRPAHFPVLNLDETKIRQVIMNFADNAIYYTPAGGHIEIRLSETPKAVELRVIDDGIGVPKEEQHHLFTKFYRAKNAQRARPDGTGLGLFMAQKVVAGQGGAIIFNSKEGKGSIFGFSFPKAKLLASSAPESKLA